MDIDEFKAYLAKTNYKCGIKNGEPLLLRTTSDPDVKFIAPEQYYELRGMGKKEKKEKKGKDEGSLPTPVPRPDPTPSAAIWTADELAKKTRTQLQAIAKKHDDVKANLGTDVLREVLTGKVK